MTVAGIFDAYREKEVRVLTRADLDVAEENIGLKGSPTRVVKSFTKEAKGKGTVVTLDTKESVAWIIEKMEEKFIL